MYMEEDIDLVDGPPVPVHERYFRKFYRVVKGEFREFTWSVYTSL